MTRTEIQKAGFASTSREADRAGVAQFATHTPTYVPPSTSQYPYGSTAPTAGPSHRTAIIGMTGLALLLAAMAGIAVVRYQDSTVPAAPPARRRPVAQSVYESQVPALARITVPASVVAQQVPHAAAAALVRCSVYAAQVPAARMPVPASVWRAGADGSAGADGAARGDGAQLAELAQAAAAGAGERVGAQVPTAPRR